MKLRPAPNISTITPYPPGKPLEELEREYGITGSIKLASNENPWGPSPKAVAAIATALASLHRYPDGSSYYLTTALVEWTGAAATEIILGNGSNELIEFLVKVFVQTGDEVISSHPSFLMYQKFVQVRGGVNTVIPLRNLTHNLEGILAAITEKTRIIFMDNPNNPCGTLIAKERFDLFLRQVPEEVVVVLDEAYVDFVAPELHIDILSYIRRPEALAPVVSLRTFSKAFGLAGLRVGFGLMHPDIASLMHRVRQPFNINLLGQIGATAALADRSHYEMTIEETGRGRAWLSTEVEKLGCRAYPSHTNFFLIDVRGDASRLYEAMLYKGVIVRSMKPYGFADCIRITVGTAAENQRFALALGECLRDLGYV